MSKVTIEDVEAILLEKKVDPTVIKDVVKRLNQEIEDAKEDKENGAKVKNRFALVSEGGEFFLISLTDEQDETHVKEDLPKAIATHNSQRKNKKKQIKTIRDAFFMLKPKTLKEVRFKRKNKLPLEKIAVSYGDEDSSS